MTNIVLGVLGVILGILILAIVGATAFLYSKRSRSGTGVPLPQGQNSASARFTKHWQSGLIALIASVFLIHLAIWWIWTYFWVQWWGQSGFLIFQIIVGVGLYLLTSRKDKNFLRPVANVLILLGCIGIGWNIWNAFWLNQNTRSVMALKSTIVKGGKAEEEVTKFWKKNLSEQSAQAMIRVARRGSHFQQFDPANPKQVYRDPKDRNKVGVMLIDESLWLERSQELGEKYNLYTLEGNLRFALWLYNQEGFGPWESIVEEERSSSNRVARTSNFGVQTPNWLKEQFTLGSSTPATTTPTNPPSPRSSTLPAGTWRPHRRRPDEALGPETEEVRAFFTENLHSLHATTEDMVIICQNESNCSHFDKDGKVKRHHNENGAADDVGLFAINEGWWAKEVAQEKARGNVVIGTYDILTPEGNTLAALHEVQKYGLDPWNAEDKEDNMIFHTGFMYAPVGSWSEQVTITRPVLATPEDRVEIITDRGELLHSGPGVKLNFQAHWVKYTSATGKPVRVEFRPK